MKSVLVKKFQPLQLLVNRSQATLNFTNRRKSRQGKETQNIVSPPTEEIVKYLNQLGQQRPFCVSFKQKQHDPL